MITEDGFFQTGDIGEIDKDGYLKITGRIKDIIVTSGGKNISPQYIENLLATDEYINQIVLYGDKKNYLTALVVPDYEHLAERKPLAGLADASPAELAKSEELYAFLMARIKDKCRDLASFEQVKKILVLAEPLTEENGELTPTMKVKRKAVLKKFQDSLDALYYVDGDKKPKPRWP